MNIDIQSAFLFNKIRNFPYTHRRTCIALGLISPWVIFSFIALKFPAFFALLLNSAVADGYIASTLYSVKTLITLAAL